MNALLQETSSWTDTVDLALCLFIYEVCNDYQFDFLPGSDFVNFLNLKPASRAVTVRPKENRWGWPLRWPRCRRHSA